MRGFPVLMAAGFLAACGSTGSAPGNDVANGADTAEAGNEAAALPPADDTDNIAAPVGGDAPAPATVASLPLRPGYYVASDTPCGQASNATLMLMERDGYGAARTSCEFRRIEKVGPTSYRVTEACAEIGGFGGGEEEAETSVKTYEIANETRFSAKSDAWESSARFCPQSSLPEPWRDNDISDVTG